jgi:hypothetical protein
MSGTGCCHPSSSKNKRKRNPRVSTKLGAIHPADTMRPLGLAFRCGMSRRWVPCSTAADSLESPLAEPDMRLSSRSGLSRRHGKVRPIHARRYRSTGVQQSTCCSIILLSRPCRRPTSAWLHWAVLTKPAVQTQADRELYSGRNFVERFFCKLEQLRAIATSFEKKATNFLAAVVLVAARIRFAHPDSC